MRVKAITPYWRWTRGSPETDGVTPLTVELRNSQLCSSLKVRVGVPDPLGSQDWLVHDFHWFDTSTFFLMLRKFSLVSRFSSIATCRLDLDPWGWVSWLFSSPSLEIVYDSEDFLYVNLMWSEGSRFVLEVKCFGVWLLLPTTTLYCITKPSGPSCLLLVLGFLYSFFCSINLRSLNFTFIILEVLLFSLWKFFSFKETSIWIQKYNLLTMVLRPL